MRRVSRAKEGKHLHGEGPVQAPRAKDKALASVRICEYGSLSSAKGHHPQASVTESSVVVRTSATCRCHCDLAGVPFCVGDKLEKRLG